MPIIVTGQFVTPGSMAVQCIISFFSLFGLGGLTPGPKFIKLSGGLQQAPLRHPATFHPDHTNGLRDVCYQISFTFWPWGLIPGPKFTKREMTCYPPRSTVLSNFIALRQPTPDISITKHLQTNKDRNSGTKSKRYIATMSIGMWGLKVN